MDQNLTSAIAAINIAERLGQIGQKHGLHLDQIGLLEKEVRAIAEDGADPDDFVDKIEEHLNLSTEAAIDVATDVNLEIFMAIREAMMKNPDAGSAPRTISANPTAENREDILAEIENPTPTAHPISSIDQTRPGPAMQREIIAAQDKAVARDFIGNKLSGATSVQAQASSIPASAQPAPKPKSYAADPYREPVA